MMKSATSLNDNLFVLFGAGGDLSWRLVVSVVFNLYLDGHLPQRFKLLAVDRVYTSDADLAVHFYQGITENSRRGEPLAEAWKAFSGLGRLEYTARAADYSTQSGEGYRAEIYG